MMQRSDVSDLIGIGFVNACIFQFCTIIDFSNTNKANFVVKPDIL